MSDRQALLHDINIIAHLADRLDMDDKDQIRAVLLMQKNGELMKSAYGKKFIGRLIGVFTDRDVPQSDLFTGEKLTGKFPLNSNTVAAIKKFPEKFAEALEKPAEKKPEEKKPEKLTVYQMQEIEFRRREHEAELENEQRMKEAAELKAAQEKLDKEEAHYQKMEDTARKAAEGAKTAVDSAIDAAGDISDKVYKFSKASEGEGNNPMDLFADIRKPWKYLNIYWVLFLLFLAFGYWLIMTKSAGAIVPEVILGAALIPFAGILYLDEIQGIYEERPDKKRASMIFLFGAIIAMIMTLIAENVFTGYIVFNVIFNGLFDELIIYVIMLAMVMYHIRRTGKNMTVLEGIWTGACFGSGFAIYQTCQSALSAYIGDQRATVFMWRLISQSFLSVGGHIAWAAICGGALSVIVTESGVIKSSEFAKMSLLAVLYPVIMQMLWDMPFLDAGFYGFSLKNLLLGILSMWVINIFLHRGIREAIAAKSAHQESSRTTEETQP